MTVAQAADALNISQDAVRKRIARDTIPNERDESGRVYVYLSTSETVHKTDQDTGQDAATKTVQDTYIRSLEDQIAFLRSELERKDAILLSLTERIPELEAPQEATEAAEAAEEQQGRGEPRPATGGAQEGTEHLRQRVGGLAPVTKLPWWHYAIGLFLGFLAGFLTSLVIELLLVNQPLDIPAFVFLLAIFAIAAAIAWWPPAIFGLWIGYRKRDLRFWSQVLPLGALVGGVTSLGAMVAIVGLSVDLLPLIFSFYAPEYLIIGLPACLLFVSTSLIGNARQRRRIGRISDATPASPVSRAGQGAGRPSRDLTPLQQAMLGWGGAIISALITLVGTIITVRSGS